jgi:hypothetical protein
LYIKVNSDFGENESVELNEVQFAKNIELISSTFGIVNGLLKDVQEDRKSAAILIIFKGLS